MNMKKILRPRIRLETFTDDALYSSYATKISETIENALSSSIVNVQILTEEPLSVVMAHDQDTEDAVIITDAGHAVKNSDIPEYVFGIGCILGRDNIYHSIAIIVTVSPAYQVKSNLAEAAGVMVGRFLGGRMGIRRAHLICDCSLQAFFSKRGEEGCNVIHPSKMEKYADLHMLSHCIAGLYRVPHITDMQTIAVSASLDELMSPSKRNCVERFFTVHDYTLSTGRTRLDDSMIEIKSTRHIKPIIKAVASYSAKEHGGQEIVGTIKNAKTQQLLFRGMHSVAGGSQGADIKEASVLTSVTVYNNRVRGYYFVASIGCVIRHNDTVSRYVVIFRCNRSLSLNKNMLNDVATAYGCLLARKFMPNATLTVYAPHTSRIPRMLGYENFVSIGLGDTSRSSITFSDVAKHDRKDISDAYIEAERLGCGILRATEGGSNLKRSMRDDGSIRLGLW